MPHKNLLVIDAQNDFISGPLGSEQARAIVPSVAAKVREYAAANDRVIFTVDTHGADYLDTPEGRKLPVVHCVEDTDGWRMPAEIKSAYLTLPKERVIFIEKRTFGTLEWNNCLTDGDELLIIGLCTDICVATNALILKTMFPRSSVTIDSALCAGTSRAAHEAALAVMKSCQIDIK